MATPSQFDQRVLGLQEQKALAQKLRQSALTDMPQGQMVSGFYVAPSWTQYLAKGLQMYGGMKGEQEAKQGIENLYGEREAQRKTFLESMPKERVTPDSKVIQPQYKDYVSWATKGAEDFPTEATLGLKMGEMQQAQALKQAELEAAKADREAQRSFELGRDNRSQQARREMAEATRAFTAQEGAKTREATAELFRQKQALTEGSPEQRAEKAKSVSALLQEAAPLVSGATGSGIGAAYDWIAQQFGGAPAGAAKADQLKVLEGAIVSAMPKMSGPQSDRDVSLYRQMAAQIGDPTIPPARKMQAMETLNKINARYTGQPAMPLNFNPISGESGQILRTNIPAFDPSAVRVK